MWSTKIDEYFSEMFTQSDACWVPSNIQKFTHFTLLHCTCSMKKNNEYMRMISLFDIINGNVNIYNVKSLFIFLFLIIASKYSSYSSTNVFHSLDKTNSTRFITIQFPYGIFSREEKKLFDYVANIQSWEFLSMYENVLPRVLFEILIIVIPCA